MSSLLICFNDKAERYLVDVTDLVRCYIDHKCSPGIDTHNVILEYADKETAQIYDFTIKCNDNQIARKIYDRVCESYLNHPGIIDLRDIDVSLEDIVE